MAVKSHKVTGGGGLQLHVDETGNPDGKPILFIHGFSQCRLAWNKQMNSDLANDFRLVAMDIRGHGLSQKPKDAYGDSRLWADDVDAVIRTLGLDKPVLSGWSYGGVIMSDYVRFYGEDGISGLNFVGAVSKLGSDEAFAVIHPDFLALAEGFFSTDVETSVDALSKFMRMCVYQEPTPEDFYFFLGYNTIVPPHVRQGLFSRSLDNNDLLPKLQKPVLLTHGQDDAIVLAKAAEQHKEMIKHARMSMWPQIGHAPFWEDAERFNRELREFVQGT